MDYGLWTYGRRSVVPVVLVRAPPDLGARRTTTQTIVVSLLYAFPLHSGVSTVFPHMLYGLYVNQDTLSSYLRCILGS